MKIRAIKAIVRKDLRLVRQSKAVMLPLVLVPLIFLIGLPVLVGLAPQAAGSASEIEIMLADLPPPLRAELSPYRAEQQFILLALTYMMAPLYLIIPLMVASVIAADSFAGEKERKTIEELIHSPTSDAELFLAKVLSAWLPAVGVSWTGFVVYAAVANLAAWPTMGEIILPNSMWIMLVLWLAPATLLSPKTHPTAAKTEGRPLK